MKCGIQYSSRKMCIRDRLRGAADILAERVSDDADIRKWIREYTFKNGSLVCRAKKKDEDSVRCV